MTWLKFQVDILKNSVHLKIDFIRTWEYNEINTFLL